MQEAIRPLWLWSVASIASQVHLPFLYTWETEHQCWFPELSADFARRFEIWSVCQSLTCDNLGLVTNMALGHLPKDCQYLGPAQFEEEVGRALFGIPSVA